MPVPPIFPPPYRGARFLVADRRFCPLLPKDMQLPPSAGMEPVAAERWQSCHDACSGRGMACSAKDFWWLNSCSGRGPQTELAGQQGPGSQAVHLGS